MYRICLIISLKDEDPTYIDPKYLCVAKIKRQSFTGSKENQPLNEYILHTEPHVLHSTKVYRLR